MRTNEYNQSPAAFERRRKWPPGFTLIELVMVILLIGILAAVALPNFFDFRTDARNAATQGALGGLRSAIAIAKASIALKELPTAPFYPTLAEVQMNGFDPASHPVLAAFPSNSIMDQSAGVPVNPWSLATVPTAQWNTFWDCSALQKSFLDSTAGHINIGWCYNTNNGQIWANSAMNAGTPGNTENAY